MRILIVEDDSLIGDGLVVGLARLGFTVDWFQDGLDAAEALYQAPYDAVILDLGLPGLDGLSILKKWREDQRQEPILILTAWGEVQQKVAGLEAGADDYVVKPFALAEIAARLKALIRRRHGEVDPILVHGPVSFNQTTRQVFLDGHQIVLSPRELAILELLLLNRSHILSKMTIEEKLYSWGDEVQSNAVEVHIHHLRRKLGSDLIRTIHKTGYILNELHD